MGGVPPIIFSEILHWANEYGIYHPDQRARLVYLVQAQDKAYSAHINKKAEAEKPKV